MTYQESKELEKNVKASKEADSIYSDFMRNIKLEASKYDKKTDRFTVWSDSHNAKYIKIVNGRFHFICDFLHESYTCVISRDKIFDYLKSDYTGVLHLKTFSRTK